MTPLKMIFWIFEKIEEKGVPIPITSFVLLGVIPFLMLIILFGDELPMFFNLAILLSLIWFVSSRYLIYLGWNTAHSSFNEFKELFVDTDKLKKQYNKLCDDFYSNKILAIALPFMVGAAYVVNDYFYNASFGLHVWLTIIYGLLFLFAGVGLWNAFNSLFYINSILKNDLHINPLHPDGFGGLEPIGDFIVRATLLISTGSLVIPFALMVVSNRSLSEWTRFISIALTLVYIVIILLSFIIPLLNLNSVAKRYKYRSIGEATRNYNDFLTDMLKNPTSENQAKLNIYYSTYLLEIKKMNIWPFTGKTLIQVFSAMALPTVTLILQLFHFL